MNTDFMFKYHYSPSAAGASILDNATKWRYELTKRALAKIDAYKELDRKLWLHLKVEIVAYYKGMDYNELRAAMIAAKKASA